MERPKPVKSVRDVEEGITVEENEVCDGENFNHALVGKIWTDNPYNVRAFKSTMILAWRVKNQVEIQDLNKNLLLFRFGSKRDVENVLNNGPWSFDRNLVILQRISGDEQPSDIILDKVSFWTRIYDLPLKLRSEALAQKLGNLMGVFEEMDQREHHRTGKFLRIKVALDLRRPLRRGTNVNFQGRQLWVSFKYERLPNFCFACGRIGHQLKDCEDDEVEDSYSDIEEKDQAFGPWLRASPLPKFTEEIKRESSSGTCSKSLFSPSSNSKCVSGDKKKGTEDEVEQLKNGEDLSVNAAVDPTLTKLAVTPKEVEEVAESLGTVAIQSQAHTVMAKATPNGKKWTRKKNAGAPRKKQGPKAIV